MARKWYGSIDNRLDENKNFTKRELREGDDITMYYWSDRKCYFITKVVNQKNIFVHKYSVCADHHKAGGMGHQDWLYFKTIRDMQEYLNKCIDEGLIPCKKENLDEIIEDKDSEWAFRYNHWYEVVRTTPERWAQVKEMVRTKDLKPGASEEAVKSMANFYCRLSEEEINKVEAGETVVKYYKIEQGISFGIKDYYYDWEF